MKSQSLRVISALKIVRILVALIVFGQVMGIAIHNLLDETVPISTMERMVASIIGLLCAVFLTHVWLMVSKIGLMILSFIFFGSVYQILKYKLLSKPFGLSFRKLSEEEEALVVTPDRIIHNQVEFELMKIVKRAVTEKEEAKLIITFSEYLENLYAPQELVYTAYVDRVAINQLNALFEQHTLSRKDIVIYLTDSQHYLAEVIHDRELIA